MPNRGKSLYMSEASLLTQKNLGLRSLLSKAGRLSILTFLFFFCLFVFFFFCSTKFPTGQGDSNRQENMLGFLTYEPKVSTRVSRGSYEPLKTRIIQTFMHQQTFKQERTELVGSHLFKEYIPSFSPAVFCHQRVHLLEKYQVKPLMPLQASLCSLQIVRSQRAWRKLLLDR